MFNRLPATLEARIQDGRNDTVGGNTFVDLFRRRQFRLEIVRHRHLVLDRHHFTFSFVVVVPTTLNMA